MFVSEALAVVHVLVTVGKFVSGVYSAASTLTSAETRAVASELISWGLDLGCASKDAMSLYMTNKKDCTQLIEIVELLTDDLRQLEATERASQLTHTQQSHVVHLTRALVAAKDLIKSNVMDRTVEHTWVRQKAWIARQVMRREQIQTDIAAARDHVIRTAQLLNLSLTVHLVQSLRCSATDSEGQTVDAQQLLEYAKHHRYPYENDPAIEEILRQLHATHVDQALQTERMVTEMQRVVGQSEHALQQQLDLILQAVSRLPTAPTDAGAHRLSQSSPRMSLSLMDQVREFEVGVSLKVDEARSLGKGSGGRVLLAQCLRTPTTTVWTECAFKDMTIDPRETDKFKERHLRALRKEAQVMWILNGQMNILRLYGVCYNPPGLVFEYCNRGTLQQWLWVEVRKRNAMNKLVPSFVSTHSLSSSDHCTPTGPPLAALASTASAHSSTSSSSCASSTTTSSTTASSTHSSFPASPVPIDSDSDDDDGRLHAQGPIQGHLSLGQRLLICQELINAVAFLHSKHMAHGDIKSSNVLVHELGTPLFTPKGGHAAAGASTATVLCVRLCDFGSAKVQQSFTGNLNSTLGTSGATGGTQRWLPPERLMSDVDSAYSTSYARADDRTADVYSLGLLIAEIFTSLPPYPTLVHPHQLDHAIISHHLPYKEATLDVVSSALTRLVQACCAKLTERATLPQIRYQLWPDLMASLLAMPADPPRAALTTPGLPPPPIPIRSSSPTSAPSTAGPAPSSSPTDSPLPRSRSYNPHARSDSGYAHSSAPEPSTDEEEDRRPHDAPAPATPPHTCPTPLVLSLCPTCACPTTPTLHLPLDHLHLRAPNHRRPHPHMGCLHPSVPPLPSPRLRRPPRPALRWR